MTLNNAIAYLRPRRLHAQIAWLGAAILAGVIGLYAWSTIADQTAFETAALENRAKAHGENIATASAELIITKRYSAIEALLLRTAQFPDVQRIQVCTAEGRVLSDVMRVDGGEPMPYFDTAPKQAPTTPEVTVERREGILTVWFPIDAGELIGWVMIDHSLRDIVRVRARIIRDGVAIGIVSIVISTALFFLILRRPVRAVERATAFAGKLDEERGSLQPVETGSHEVEQLGRALNRVSMRLYNQEQAILATTTRLQAILEHAIDGIITMDAQGQIESMNPAAERMFGYRAETVVGSNFNELVPDLALDADTVTDADPLPATQANALQIHCEATAYCKDGSSFPLMIGLSEMRLDGRRLFIGIVRDISEQKRLDRMKTEFIASVSHELRTPLTSLHGSLGLLAGGEAPGLDKEAQHMIDIAYNNSGRLVRIIEEILDFEKLEFGNAKMNLEVVDLVPLVQEAVQNNAAFAQQHQVRCVLGNHIDQADVMVEPQRMIQVVDNLLGNAIRFSPEQETVAITLTRESSKIRVAVTDHGPGIPENFRKTVFQRFVQVDTSDIRYHDGVGLGLSIAKAIVESFGGSIDVASKPHVATTFYIDLPEVQGG